MVDTPDWGYLPLVVGARLQHCSYTLVNDPREILFCRQTAARSRRSGTARPRERLQKKPQGLPHIREIAAAVDYPENLRTNPCGLEVDIRVNY